VIFASGGDRPAAVSQREAEMLFRLKDATLGADNAAEWQRLFVQGVGNYLQGWQGAKGLTREFVDELLAIEKVDEPTAYKIVNLLPRDRDELRAIYAQERFSLSGDELDDILDVVAKYA
jgi:hypothetical protein